jgi:POT family proton-dependent oligopeptide transporter
MTAATPASPFSTWASTLGALIGPLVTGWLQKNWSFHAGFGAAAVGMAFGLAQYARTRKNLPDEAHHITNPLPKTKYGKCAAVAIGALTVIVIAFTTRLVTPANLARVVAGLAILAAIAYFALLLTSPKVDRTERSRVLSFIPLFIASAAFWGLFQQQFTVVAIYSEESLDRNFFGWIMPPSFVQSINPIFIIVLAGVFAAVWTKLGSRQPSTPLKFALGLVFMGIAFLMFIPFAGGGPNSTPFIGLVMILLFFTLAELFISPIGLSVATKLAPEAFRTQMVALFFLSIALGTTLAGIFAGYYDRENEVPYFSFSGVAAIILGVALITSTPAIKKLMSGIR